MKRLLTACLLFVSAVTARGAQPPSPWGAAREPVPVFSSATAPALLATAGETALPHDGCGLVRSLEFVALPGTVFRVHDCGGDSVCRVTTSAYPEPKGGHLYLDRTSLHFSPEAPAEPRHQLPPLKELQRRLERAVGIPYVWGGNVRGGVTSGNGRAFQGLDCSGLLYEATEGMTPRNTSELVSFGTGVAIAGLTSSQLTERLEPLDLLVWKGHVIIVLDKKRSIQSRLECGAPGRGGVIIRPLEETLSGLLRSRRAVDRWPEQAPAGEGVFVVRRWYGTTQ